MSKINTASILKGLNNVTNITNSLTDTAKDEMIPVDQIDLAEYNPAASNDTESDYYDLAMSIQANGLLQPLLLNRVSNNRYQLIAGEKRLTAIKRHIPEMKTVRALVYQNLDPDEAQIKLHEANNYREYTSEQKLKIYQDLVLHYQKLQDMGKFSGNTQKAIAECLNISDRQARKYKQITENLSEEQIQDIYSGDLSINAAYDIVKAPPTRKEAVAAPASPASAPVAEKPETPKAEPVPVEKAEPVPPPAPKKEAIPSPTSSPEPSKKPMEKTNCFPLTFSYHDGEETAEATIISLENYGSHYKVQLEGRSGFSFYIGKSADGHFMCAPSFGAGCPLASYTDYFWNRESLEKHLPRADAFEIAHAIKNLSKNGLIEE